MNCTKCGQPFLEDAKFCNVCGTPRPETPVAEPQAAPAAEPAAEAPVYPPEGVMPGADNWYGGYPADKASAKAQIKAMRKQEKEMKKAEKEAKKRAKMESADGAPVEKLPKKKSMAILLVALVVLVAFVGILVVSLGGGSLEWGMSSKKAASVMKKMDVALTQTGEKGLYTYQEFAGQTDRFGNVRISLVFMRDALMAVGVESDADCGDIILEKAEKALGEYYVRSETFAVADGTAETIPVYMKNEEDAASMISFKGENGTVTTAIFANKYDMPVEIVETMKTMGIKDALAHLYGYWFEVKSWQ